MDYGEIFVGTFRTIWRHKKLWVFGILGTLLSAIGGAIYLGTTLSWQSNWLAALNELVEQPGGPNAEQFPGWFFGSLAGLLAGLAILTLLSLLNYVINLVMRSATINEAATAWRGGRTEMGRGLQAGAERAIYVFLLDLVWWVPIIMIAVGAYAAGILGFVGLVSATSQSNDNAGAVLMGLCGLVCGLLCLGLLIAVIFGVFAPLMYQSAVQGRRNLGAAISEGWRLAKANLGLMIIFWLLLLILAFVLNLLLQLITVPLMMPWLTGWMGEWIRAIGDMAEGGMPALPNLNAGWLALAGLGSALTSLLFSSFMQTFNLTLYAEVYRRLSGGAAAPAAVSPGGGAGPQPPSTSLPTDQSTDIPDLGLTVLEETGTASEEPAPRA